MADSRYAPTYPVAGRRSPTYNPARLSMPTVPSAASAPGQYSLYSGPIPLMPPSSHQHPHPHQHQQHYDAPGRRQTNPQTTTTYQVAHDPVTRSSSVRQAGNTSSHRSHRSSTMDSNTTRPIIVTASGSSRPHAAASSHSSGRSGERSPTRDALRSSDEQYYSQPASSIRSRSSHRPTYSATVDNEELARLRERGDLRLLEPYRPRGSGGPVYHSSTTPRPVGPTSSTGATAGSSSKEHKRTAVPDEGYEYYRPSDLVRYDLENPSSAAGSSRRRRESVDRGSYYRPSVVVNSGYDRSRPPPTMRGLEKINRSSAVYDGPPVRMPVPAVPPAVPLAPPPDTARRSASDTISLNPPARRERPSSMYHDERAYRHQDSLYYPPREEDHHHHGRRNVDREYDRRYDAGDGFRDDSVPSRGFGIRTDDEYDPAASYRRPVGDYVEMPLPPEPRHRSDESLDLRGERDREERAREDRARRERLRAREEEEEQRRPTVKDEERGFRQKAAAGIGAAASALGLGPVIKGEKGDREAKEEATHRGRSPDVDPRRDRRKESLSRDRSRSRSRERSTEPDRAHSHDRDDRRDRYGRYEEREEEYKERNRRATEDKLNGASPSSSGQFTPTSDDERQVSEISKHKSRRSFKPNDPADLMDIKAELDELDKKGVVKEVDSRKATASPEKRVVDARSHDKSFPEDDNRGRELVPTSSEKEKQVRVVSPPREKGAPSKPIKGILKPPSEKFPEDPNPIREGVAPHKDDKTKKDAPAGARWTKIRRDIVNPEALSAGKERFEVRDNFVIVLRVLNKEEIEQYAYATQLIREKRHEERLRKEKLEREYDRGYSKDRDYEKDRPRERDEDDKDRRHHKTQRRDDEDEDRRYREPKERDWDRDRERRKHRHESDVDPYDEGQRAIEYHGGHSSSGYHRSHKDRDD